MEKRTIFRDLKLAGAVVANVPSELKSSAEDRC